MPATEKYEILLAACLTPGDLLSLRRVRGRALAGDQEQQRRSRVRDVVSDLLGGRYGRVPCMVYRVVVSRRGPRTPVEPR